MDWIGLDWMDGRRDGWMKVFIKSGEEEI